MNMVNDVVNFSMIWGLFLIGGTFACYYVIAGDLAESDAQISSLASVAFYIFQTFIGQQDWDSVRSYKSDDADDAYIFDPWRSRIIQFYMFIFAAMGTILLLNLLIAMMASSYQRVQDISFQQLSKQKVQTTYDLDTSRGAMPAPANIISYIFVVYWISFEMMAYVLTFGHRQFNEEFFSPLNKESHQYRKNDKVKFMKHGKKQSGIVERKIPLSERNLRRTGFRPQLSVDNIGIAPDECDLRVRWNSVPLELLDSQILKVKKPFFKHRESRCPTIDAENYYCRYCRYNLTDDSISIEYYLALFEKRGQHIDPEDKLYIKSLLALTDNYDIPQPKTMELCPNCFRPHRVYEDGSRDSLNRMMFILEIVSYMVFYLTLRWMALLLLFIPANIVKILKWMFKKFFETVGVVDTKSDSQLNFSEENDDYRAKVRLVSKQEEKMVNIVRRIDVNVKRLEDRLVGSMLEDEDVKEEDHILRSDEFNEEVVEMKKELMARFDSIEKLLTSGGFGT